MACGSRDMEFLVTRTREALLSKSCNGFEKLSLCTAQASVRELVCRRVVDPKMRTVPDYAAIRARRDFSTNGKHSMPEST
jgi:hypothetical protein